MHLQFKVTLRHCTPSIWRRFSLDEESSFEDLNEAIQDSMGWMNCHLWEFRTVGRPSRVITSLDPGGEGEGPAHEVPIAKFFDEAKKKCAYLYDFGDGWAHEVVYEKRVEAPEDGNYRALLGGARACPPEDCGGPPGYERLVEFRRTGVDPYGDDPQELDDWLGDWEPDAFDMELVKPSFDAGSLMLVEPIVGDDSGVMALVEEQARRRGLGDDYILRALAVWNGFYMENGGPGRRRAKTHAACVDYVTSNLDRDYMPLTQQDVARLYGVSAPSISNNYRDYGDPSEFVRRSVWVPNSSGVDDDLLMRIIGLTAGAGMGGFGAPVRAGCSWRFLLDDADPERLMLVCVVDGAQERFRMVLDETAMPSTKEIINDFVMPCVLFVEPRYVPEVVELAHPIFESCANVLESLGARVLRLSTAAVVVPERPDWLGPEQETRLLRALERSSRHMFEGEMMFLGSIERGGEITRFLLELDTMRFFPRWSNAPEPGGAGSQRAVMCLVHPEVDGWFDSVDAGLEPMPTFVKALDRSGDATLSSDLLELYLLAVEALGSLLERYEAHPNMMPVPDSVHGFVPLCTHTMTSSETVYLFGPLG